MEGLTVLVALIIAAAAWILFVAAIFWAVKYLSEFFHEQN